MNLHEPLRSRSGIITGTVPEKLREEHGAWIREQGTRDIRAEGPIHRYGLYGSTPRMDGRSAAGFGGGR